MHCSILIWGICLLLSVLASSLENHPNKESPASFFTGLTTFAPPLEVGIPIYVGENSNTTLYVEELLEVFIENLKVFVSDNKFHFEFFESNAEQLEHLLSKIRIVVERVLPNQLISEHFKIANFMFQTMVESLIHLKYFHNSDINALRVINRLIELNISFFALYDSRGFADPERNGFLLQIIRLAKMLEDCETEFKLLHKVSYGIRFMYDRQLLRAKNTLMILERSIPRKYA